MTTNAPPETGGISATSSPSLSSLRGLRVLAVHRVQQSRRLVAERERGPDVGDAPDAVELDASGARALSEAGEEPNRDGCHALIVRTLLPPEILPV